MSLFGRLGVPAALRLRCVFLAASAFALGVLGVLARSFSDAAPIADDRPVATSARPAGRTLNGFPAQICLRAAALVVGWNLTLSVFGYGLFAPRFLGYEQPQNEAVSEDEASRGSQLGLH